MKLKLAFLVTLAGSSLYAANIADYPEYGRHFAMMSLAAAGEINCEGIKLDQKAVSEAGKEARQIAKDQGASDADIDDLNKQIQNDPSLINPFILEYVTETGANPADPNSFCAQLNKEKGSNSVIGRLLK